MAEGEMGSTGLLQRKVLALLGACALALALAPAVHAAGQAPAAEKTAPAEPVPGKEKVLEKARASYYSLQKEGFRGYKCSLSVNWDKMLHDMFKNEPLPEDVGVKLKELHKLHFELSVSGTGAATITHRVDGELDPSMAENVHDIYGGIEQSISGVFDTWRGFMVQPLLPQPGVEYKLEKTRHQYRISYREEGSDVVTQLGEDLAITSLHVTSKESDSTVRPQFTRTAGGFLLTSIDAVSQDLSPPSVGVLHVTFDNQLVDGFQLPVKLVVSGDDNGTAFVFEISLTDCHAASR